MRKASQSERRAAERAAHLQYQREHLLLDRRARLDSEQEIGRRKHEWRMMITEKALFALLVGASLAAASVLGNVFVERYKSASASLQARTLSIKTASNKVWGKLVLYEESVESLGDATRNQILHRNIAFFKDDRMSDQKAVEEASIEMKRRFGEVLEILQAEELNLGPDVHALYTDALQEIAMIGGIYDSQARSGAALDKLGTDALNSARNELRKRKEMLFSFMNEP